MRNGVEAEGSACQLHDARHEKRLAQLFARLSEKPVPSIPSACHGWAETVAAYRLLDNPAIGEQEMLSGHQHATLERIRAQAVVWLVQAPTFLHDGTTQQQPGRGTVKVKNREEDLLPCDRRLYARRRHLRRLGSSVVAASRAARGPGAQTQAHRGEGECPLVGRGSAGV